MTSFSDLYRELILDHYKHPKHYGSLEDPAIRVHRLNPTCGDEVTVSVRLADGRVEDIAFEGHGCSISQASASVLTDLVVGRDLDEVRRVDQEFHKMLRREDYDEELVGDAVAFEGVASLPLRVKCAILGWGALRDAIIEDGVEEPTA